MKNKKLLLGLGGILTVAAPTLTIVSCSSSGDGSEISSETQKEYDEILSDNKNLLLDSLKNSKTSNEIKTVEEVKKIADDKLNNINEKDLEKLFKTQTMLGAEKTKNGKEFSFKFFDIKNFRYDKSNKKVSFDYVLTAKSGFFDDKNEILDDCTENEIFSFVNIKLEAYTAIDNNNNGGQIVVPIINFAKNQDKDASAKIKDYTASWYLNKSKMKEEIKKEDPNITDKEIEMEFDSIEKERNNEIALKKKWIGKEIGHSNEEFNISSRFEIGFYGLLVELGYRDDNDVFVPKPIVGSSILFSQEKDKKIEWEIYKLKTNENPSKN